ncbi:YbaN family protein [Ligilactobacillus equi]|uniref:DUF454 family protein n=1 Tax=Ligilactobacillus equi TaxID=137357 RepID=UPI002ECFE22F
MKYFKRSLWLVLAIIFFALAGVGLMLPILPQIPFFLAGIFCLAQFSEKFHRWLQSQRLYQKLHHSYAPKFDAFFQKEKMKFEKRRFQTWYHIMWFNLLLLVYTTIFK